MGEFSLRQLAELVGAENPAGDGLTIRGVGTLEEASPDQLVFAESEKFLESLTASRAEAALVTEAFPDIPGKILLRVENPRLGFLRVAEQFVRRPGGGGIHPDASVHPNAVLGEGVSVGACAVVEAGVTIGADSHVGAGSCVGEGVAIGTDCLIETNVSLLPGVRIGDRVILHANCVIGGDGFGYAWLGDHHHKVPQLGTVEIEDDVEIGCGACVDRATLGVTRIGRGTKLDNLVHIAHNCDLGEHVVLAGQVGMAGSVTIGKGTVAGGHAAFADHIVVGDGVQVAGKSGVTKNVPDGEKVAGFPARPVRQEWREQAAVSKLPDVLKQIKAMQKEIQALQQQLDELSGG